MSCAAWASTFDIHGGGQDLQFPTTRTRSPRAKAPTAPLCPLLDAQRLPQYRQREDVQEPGNFFTIRDVLAKFDGETLRFFMLRTHYRRPFNFSDSHLDDARVALTRRFTPTLDACRRPPFRSTGRKVRLLTSSAAMDDDFNTPGPWPCSSIWPTRSIASRPVQAGLLKALGAVLGILQASAPLFPARRWAEVTRPPDRGAHRRPRRRQGRARLCRGRCHPRRTDGPGRDAQRRPAGTTWVKS